LQGVGNGAFTDTSTLLRYGFALPMENITVFDSDAYSVTVPVEQEIGGNMTEIGRVSLRATEDLTFELPHDWSNSWLRYELSAPETLAPPVEADTAVGRVTVYVQDIRVGEAMLLTRETVLPYTPPEYPEPESETEAAEENAQHEIIHEQFQIFTGVFSFLNNEYVLTLIVPLTLSFTTLAVSFFLMVTREKRRMRRILRQRRVRFNRYPHYRYKSSP
jgi:hypothetical protein